MPRVVSINIGVKKGVAKIPVENGFFKKDSGLVGDVHSGPGIRQVSLLAKESIDRFNRNVKLRKICVKKGMFGENLTTEGIDLHTLKIGTKLKINNVVLEVSKIGKECHTLCSIGRKAGDCIMPKEGIFAKVIEEGEVKVGDEIVLLPPS
jgi:MOSC domain-containing protein YiiM